MAASRQQLGSKMPAQVTWHAKSSRCVGIGCSDGTRISDHFPDTCVFTPHFGYPSSNIPLPSPRFAACTARKRGTVLCTVFFRHDSNGSPGSMTRLLTCKAPAWEDNWRRLMSSRRNSWACVHIVHFYEHLAMALASIVLCVLNLVVKTRQSHNPKLAQVKTLQYINTISLEGSTSIAIYATAQGQWASWHPLWSKRLQVGRDSKPVAIIRMMIGVNYWWFLICTDCFWC